MTFDLEAIAVRRAEEQVRDLRDLRDPPPPRPCMTAVNPCPCGCGREIALRTSAKGPTPKYATSACRFRLRRKARSE